MAQCNELARCGRRCEKQENPMGCAHSCMDLSCLVCYPLRMVTLPPVKPTKSVILLDVKGLGQRPNWNNIWMDFASNLALRSTCRRSSVGCVVVSTDNSTVLGLGYNGGPKGLNNDCLSDEPGKCGHLHAEINALLKANYRDAASRKAYLTLSPCLSCATALVNFGIEEVIYRDAYRDLSSLEVLRAAGVKVRQFPSPGVSERDLYLNKDGT